MRHNDIDKLAEIANITRGRIERLTVFRDFFELLAIMISNNFDPVHFSSRHERAEEIRKTYSEAEMGQFRMYFNILSEMLANNLKHKELPDVLGRLYEKHGYLSSEQELSPDSISEICHRITINPEEQIAKHGFVEYAEPTCGSGGLLFKGAELMLQRDYNIINTLVVFGNDVNSRSVHMAYTQASMYCIPAVITQADIFTLQEADRWYTPAYILGNWVWRRPLGHTTGRNRDDEMLKMMTDPTYAAIRRIWGWPKGEANE